MNEKHTKDSKYLSLLLRHKPEVLNLDIDSEGWVKVDQLIKNSEKRFTKKKLEEIVESDSKKRYEFDNDIFKNKIRALQGHSSDKIKINFKKECPPNILYHGTSKENYKKILETREIKPCSRQYVHLSQDYETAKIVGKRHNKDNYIVIKIDTYLMNEDDFEFFLTDNGIWLTNFVPVKYFIWTI